MSRRIVITDSQNHLTPEMWKSILSRVDFMLERHAPTLHAVLEDKKCPPRKDPPIEDSI